MSYSVKHDYIENLKREVSNYKEEYWRAVQSDASQSYIMTVKEHLDYLLDQLEIAVSEEGKTR